MGCRIDFVHGSSRELPYSGIHGAALWRWRVVLHLFNGSETLLAGGRCRSGGPSVLLPRLASLMQSALPVPHSPLSSTSTDIRVDETDAWTIRRRLCAIDIAF